ncbi:MAG: response regulator [Chloroflexi bacterium]|nr:response regulator [Chloroflexota bacterium]
MKGNIIVVDDVVANLKILFAALKQEGYKVRPLGNPLQIFDVARSTNPGLILLDVRMPGMDGFEVCSKLKADPELAHIPIIFISAQSAGDEKSRRYAEYGAVDYIRKPFVIEDVLAKVSHHILPGPQNP